MACSRRTEDGADKRTAGQCCSLPPHVIPLALIAAVSAGGAFLGSIYGFNSGLINKRGYKGAFARAGSHAKYLSYTFNQTSAIICGVEDLVFYILRSLHAKAGILNLYLRSSIEE
ncbi:Mitochondrial import inner membrane translocase subunit TIM22-3 [Acorus calamus]|uniref:Mitochondrial import inner membrane translocase subunit TIM22-3 n=1 Tax=Acorus calamus TaxID=4465 RepID=A0AAV9ER89_ACOCL|nr:Mitochondrial import inner membrane translocase subunit TIM22-3 [Acorus calamus]